MTETIKFYRVSDAYGCFSNFSSHRVKIGLLWPTTEHYFQAQKFSDRKLRQKIQREKSPMKAAKMGRDRTWPLRSDWNDVKDEIMLEAIRTKVAQHADVRDTLLKTGDAIIIEHTANDNYWADGGDGTGKNMLGKILMQVREELKSK